MDRLIKKPKKNSSSKIDPLSCVRILDALEKLPKWDGKQTIAFFRLFMILTTHDSINELMLNMELNMRCLTTNHDKYDLNSFSKKDKRTINRFKRLIYQGLNLGIHYFPETSLPFKLTEMYKNMRELYETKYVPPLKYSHEKLRIGYLSADINANAVNLFMYPMFNNFSDKFDVYIYYNNDKNDDISNSLREKFTDRKDVSSSVPSKTRWFDVDKLNAFDLNRLIREHEIDILFDLSVHCLGTRTDVMEKRPCRKIVNFCGYPSTSGLPFHTHRIIDSITDPDGTYEHYTEKLIRIEKCFLCFKPFIIPPEIKYNNTGQRPLTIGVLNKFEKINQPVMLKLLSTLAKDNPDAIFYFPIGKQRNHYYINQVVPEQQCRFLCDKFEMEDYYSQMNMFDIVIDTTPYSGTTTTASTLLMGLVPFTIYKNGNKHVSNVSTSLILNTDPELKNYVCNDEDDYVKKINQALVSLREQKLLKDFSVVETERRKEIRAKFLKANDPEAYIRRFEKVLMDIYNDERCN